jgi:hypothetical protein
MFATSAAILAIICERDISREKNMGLNPAAAIRRNTFTAKAVFPIEGRAARIAANLRIIKEAEAAKVSGPKAVGEGYSLEELAGDMGEELFAVGGEPDGCSEAYSLDEMNAV